MTRVLLRRLPGADPAVDLPAYATAGAAGADIRANLPEEDRGTGMILDPFFRTAVPTGLSAEIPEGYEMQLRPRSGLALRSGVTLLNSPGTVDSDYRGEIKVLLINFGDAPHRIEHGARIAQAVIAPTARATFEEAETLSDSDRAEGGFGSTGQN